MEDSDTPFTTNTEEMADTTIIGFGLSQSSLRSDSFPSGDAMFLPRLRKLVHALAKSYSELRQASITVKR